MITIDLQDDDANRKKKSSRSEETKGRGRQRSLDKAEAIPRDQLPSQGKSGLIARILRLLGNKE